MHLFNVACTYLCNVQGLVVPVLRNVESMSYADIEKTIHAMGVKVRRCCMPIVFQFYSSADVFSCCAHTVLLRKPYFGLGFLYCPK